MTKNKNNISKLLKIDSVELERNIRKYKNQIIVIKYGGSAMIDPNLSKSFSKKLAAFESLHLRSKM